MVKHSLISKAPQSVVVALIVLTAIICAVSAISIHLLRAEAVADEKILLESVAVAVSDDASKQVKSIADVLERVVNELTARHVADKAELIRQVNLPLFGKFLQQQQSSTPEVDLLAVVDQTGDISATTKNLVAHRNSVYKNDFFAIHERFPAVPIGFSSVRDDLETNTRSFLVSRRITGPAGQFLGVVLARVPLQSFSGLWRQIGIDRYASIQMYRPDHVIVAQFPLGGRSVPNLGLDGDFTRAPGVLNKDTIMVATSDYRFGVGASTYPLLTAIRRLDPFPLAVAVSLADDQYLTSWRRSAWLILGVAAAGIFGAIISFYALFAVLRRREKDLQLALEAERKADERSAAKSEFLSMMSHEIRTPMSGMVGMTEVMMSTPLNEEQAHCMSILYDSGQQLMEIINQILDFSKIEAGKLDLVVSGYSPAELVRRIAALHTAEANKKALTLSVDLTGALPVRVLGDALRVRQVLSNLISNAIKFTSTGEVMVSLHAEPLDDVGSILRLTFSVKDTGIGINPVAQGRIFQPFVQVDRDAQHECGGTGLGLTICNRLVGLMGGTLHLESEEGRGARFWFSIDCLKDTSTIQPPLPPAFSTMARGSSVSSGVRENARILLVEDQESNRFIASMLLMNAGFDVVTAENGKEALESCMANDFDIVLMDSTMPIMNGSEATHAIRLWEVREKKRPVTIIALTANAFGDVATKLLADGMDDFLSKPYRQAELLAMVDKWLAIRSRAV